MFLRVVRAPSGNTGVKHEYVRVVEAYRDHEGKTQHQTIINLGRKDLLAENTELTRQVKVNTDLLEEIRRQVVTLNEGATATRANDQAEPPPT